MAWWGFCLVLAIVALLAIAYVVIQPPPRDGAAPFDELAAAIRMKGPATALTIAALLAIAFCFRQIWLELLALRPGRIDVEPFTAGSTLRDVDVEQLTLAFRQRLAELHLHAPAGAPGTSAEGQFLDVLGGSAMDARNWLGSAISVLRAAKPSHAWQVRGVLIERDNAPCHGLTVQVLRLPDRGNPPETLWGTTWDDAVRQGADYATAAILPRTRRCTQQWAAWRRFRMGGTLLGNYEDAVMLEGGRRYDEALQAYYLAADDDPMNMALRLRIGLLQERMGLYLDALATYQGMIHVGKARKRGRTLERRLARLERRRSIIVARYRRLVLLGGSELAEQWLKVGEAGAASGSGPEPERAARRRLLRDRVEPFLRQDIEKVARRKRSVEPGEPVPMAIAFKGERPRPRSRCSTEEALSPQAYGAARTPEEDPLFRLRELFGLLALREARAVQRKLRPHLIDRHLILSRETVALTARCIAVRLDWVQYNLTGGESDAWPPVPERFDAELARIEHHREFNRWHEHYNAACLYALPLLAFESEENGIVPALPADLRERLAAGAVARLSSATANADSAYIAGRRDWVLSEDPDLDGLRTSDFFKQFEAMNFPSREPTPDRPLHVKTLESSRYVHALLEDAARCWEQTWHKRGRELNGDVDVHELLQWWKDECEAWQHVPRVALNNRHWPARADLVRRLHDHADTYSFARPEIPFPRYSDEVLTKEELGDTYELRRTAADRVAKDGEDHLHHIGETVRKAQVKGKMRPKIDDIEQWQAVLRQLDARGREPRRFLLAVLCDHHAALWQLFAEWVSANSEEERDAKEKAFVDQIGDTDLIWCGAATWWRSPVLVRAAVHRGARPALVFGRWANKGGKATPVA